MTCLIGTSFGQVSERPKETVLKTVVAQATAGSNPALSAWWMPRSSFRGIPVFAEIPCLQSGLGWNLVPTWCLQ